jgi:SAM-dependent methyltransferase
MDPLQKFTSSAQKATPPREAREIILNKPILEILIDPEPSARECSQMNRWDELAPSQQERTRGNSRQSGTDEKQQSLIDRFPKLATRDALILDFGAGIGCATNLFRERGARVVALELSPAMAELTVHTPIVPYDRVVRYSATGNRELSELDNNLILPGSVSCIICYGAFHNFVDRGANSGDFDEVTALKVLKRMHDLLEPGGKISIEYLPPQPPVSFHEQTTVMDPIRFRRLFEQAGFQVNEDKPVFAYFHDKLKVDIKYQFIEGSKGA